MAIVSPSRIRDAAARTREAMRRRMNVNRQRQQVRRRLNFSGIPTAPTYENKNLPANAMNLFSLNAFKKGDKVMKYGPNKYMKVSDFTRYLNTPRGGEMIFNQFFSANGNKKFFAPNGVPFRRGNVKFYKFV